MVRSNCRLDAVIFHQPKTNRWDSFTRLKTDKIVFGESCSDVPVLGQVANFESVAVFCAQRSNPEIFYVREKLFRVDIRSSTQIKFMRLQINHFVQSTWRQKITSRKTISSTRPRSHLTLVQAKVWALHTKGLERSGEIGRHGAAGSKQKLWIN
jgi:hypothetical protein